MPSRLILARHGNTFAPTEKPVWVGAGSDLPLVEKGLAQAQTLADALKKADIIPTALLTGPLQRTRRTAEIVAQILNLSTEDIRVDTRLTEIDYGAWEGKSTAEIKALGGGAELAAWDRNAIFPTSPGWLPPEPQVIAHTQEIVSEAISGTSLIVTSNGILRFFARLAVNAGDFPDRKVATGRICVMERDQTGGWRIRQWNQSPDILYSMEA